MKKISDHAPTIRYPYKSITAEYNGDLSKPQPGDIVMTQIFRLNHPACYEENWNETHLILGAVHSFKLLKGGLKRAHYLCLTYG